MNLVNVWQRISAADNNLCLLVNRMSRRRALAVFFRFISRIGDGIFWYALMAVLPLLYGLQGAYAAGVMALVGVLNLWLYRKCKGSISRERPFISLAPINLAGVPLDRYSFPSGHTQHAVGFSVVAVAFFPQMAVVLYPMAFLVALSRPLLGLHYPSDVLMGAALGYGVAQLILSLISALF
jgi:undecaprenyl-diphosphatase